MSSGEILIALTLTESSRLDLAVLQELKKTYPDISRSFLKRLFLESQILVVREDGAEIARPASWLLPSGKHRIRISGDLNLTESYQAKAASEGSFVPIAYEDENLLVLDKPSGLPSLPHASDLEKGTLSAVTSALAHFPTLEGVGRNPLEPGLLHRLDTGTSGLLSFAKNQAEYDRLRALWKSGGVVKTYRALVDGMPDFDFPKKMELLLAHHPKSAKKMIVLDPDREWQPHRGKPLATITHLLRLHGSHDLEIKIQTGVMHQIRCTLAHLGYPILGDAIYGGAKAPRLMLHAWKLEIPSGTEQVIRITAPLPEKFKEEFNEEF